MNHQQFVRDPRESYMFREAIIRATLDEERDAYLSNQGFETSLIETEKEMIARLNLTLDEQEVFELEDPARQDPRLQRIKGLKDCLQKHAFEALIDGQNALLFEGSRRKIANDVLRLISQDSNDCFVGELGFLDGSSKRNQRKEVLQLLDSIAEEDKKINWQRPAMPLLGKKALQVTI